MIRVFLGLSYVRRQAGREAQYGALAKTYTGAFHRKWIRSKDAVNQEELLGNGDIQSLADLGNSFGFIERMNAIPVDPRTILHLLVAMLLPLSPCFSP